MRNVGLSLLAVVVIGLAGPAGPSALFPGPVAPSRCDVPALRLERHWRGTGEWRALAPYPVPRDASPTDSIGVWLERWQLPDGSVELRRISAEETVVATLTGEACAPSFTSHRRQFDSVAMARAFTDARLRALLRDTRDGIIYVWSPRMPLSIIGLDEARIAARSLGIAFTAVVAEAQPADLRDASVDTAYQQSLDALELVYRNATIHYPTAIFYRNARCSARPFRVTRDAAHMSRSGGRRARRTTGFARVPRRRRRHCGSTTRRESQRPEVLRRCGESASSSSPWRERT